MLSLAQIEQDLTFAIKAKDQVAMDTLRGLKTRLQNEKISRQKDLSEAEIAALVKNEVKRRREAAESYKAGGRAELAEKELREKSILEKYLPEQMGEAELSALTDKFLSQNRFSAKDFGAAMGKLKAYAGDKADGGALAKLLKEKLK